MVNVEQVKELRDQTGVSLAECKKALEVSGGNIEQALESLHVASGVTALKKAGRQLGAGVISTYIHSNNAMGAMLELDCETDFVAKNEGFKQLAQDLAMHVAAFAPQDLTELLIQPFVKDSTQTIADAIKTGIQKFGEKIELVRFERFVAPGQ